MKIDKRIFIKLQELYSQKENGKEFFQFHPKTAKKLMSLGLIEELKNESRMCLGIMVITHYEMTEKGLNAYLEYKKKIK
jgi:hypothetical protein